MNPILLFILSIIGLLALYWALIGQWRWNKIIRNEDKELAKPGNAEQKENR